MNITPPHIRSATIIGTSLGTATSTCSDCPGNVLMAAGAVSLAGLATWTCSKLFRKRPRRMKPAEPHPAALLKEALGAHVHNRTDDQLEEMAALIAARTDNNRYHATDAYRALPAALAALTEDGDDARAWERARTLIDSCGRHAHEALTLLPNIAARTSPSQAMELAEEIAARISRQTLSAYEALPALLEDLPRDRVVDLLAFTEHRCKRQTAAAYRAFPQALKAMRDGRDPETRADLLRSLVDICGEQAFYALWPLPRILDATRHVLTDEQLLSLIDLIVTHGEGRTEAFTELPAAIDALAEKEDAGTVMDVLGTVITQSGRHIDPALRAIPELMKVRSAREAGDLICTTVAEGKQYAPQVLRILPAVAEKLPDNEIRWLVRELLAVIPHRVNELIDQIPELLAQVSYDRIPALLHRVKPAGRWGVAMVFSLMIEVLKATNGALTAEHSIEALAAMARHLRGGVTPSAAFHARKAIVPLLKSAPALPTTAWWSAVLAADINDAVTAILAMQQMLPALRPAERMTLLNSINPSLSYKTWSKALFITFSLMQARRSAD